LKNIACKLIKKLAESSETYGDEDEEDAEYYTKHVKKVKGRYEY
jgi:hypothetical protein